jgi:hypothetical protein
MTDGSIRASDNDREEFVAALREAYSEGRLTLDEFEERTSAAYAARTWGDLRTLTEDLPYPPVLAVNTGQPEPELGPRQALDILDQPPSSAPPVTRMGQDGMRAGPQYRRPFGGLLPVVLIWTVIAAMAGNSHLEVVLAVVFVVLLGIRALGGNRR